MVFEEVLAEIKQLPRAEQQALLEYLQQALSPDAPPKPHHSSLERVRGILKGDGPPPTDEEVQTMYDLWNH